MAQRLLRSLGVSLSRPVQQFHGIRSLSTGSSSGRVWGGRQNRNLPESAPESDEEFTRRIRDGSSDDNPSLDRFFSDLSRLNKQSDSGRGNSSEKMGGLDGSSSTLSDGMDGELKKAAAYFDFDIDEVEQDDYSFRPDVNFVEDGTYDIKDLDLTKPGVSKPVRREEFEVTTEEVLRKADFRNVRFLANFITEAGIIIKRSQTGISAKAQRKVAREIKTARAFGLMPFTTMGTKSFIFGKTMESLEKDYEYDAIGGRGDENDPLEV